MNMEAALAHCSRDANGLLKLGGLWLNARLAHSSLSNLVRRHELKVTVVKGWAKTQGIYAHESVARKLAQLIPAQDLWRDGGLETNGEPRQPVEAPVATTNAVTDEISPADPSDSGAPEQNSGVTEPTLRGDTAIATRTFNGLIIERRACDGYFNGTNMCTAFKKHFKHYLESQRASEYLNALARAFISKVGIPTLRASSKSRVGIPTLDFATVRASLVQVQHGGENRGSWIHERVAVDLARWLSPDFAVWMDGWVLEGLGLSSVPSASAPATQPAPSIFHLPPSPIVMKSCPTGCLDGGPPHFYIIRIPSQSALQEGEDGDLYRGGRTKDFDARLLEHRLSYGNGVHMALRAPYYGHMETLWHRHIRPNAITQEPREERILASKIPIGLAPKFIMELHGRRQTELQLKSLPQAASKKRTREEAEEERVIAEIDANRDLAVAELGAKVAEIDAKRAFARDREQLSADREQLSADRERLMLRLASEGNADAIKALLAPKP